MEQRPLGGTGRDVSIIGLGCWQLGSDWGAEQMSEAQALAVLNGAIDAGVTFLDTADVYGDGESEKRIGRLLAERGRDGLTVATKMGQRAEPHVAEAYNLQNFRSWIDRSRRNLGIDVIDLMQLHCPPSSVFSDDRVYDELDQLVSEGSIDSYGVSVETCDEALAAIAHPRVTSVQLILNVFRQKPLEQVIPAAAAAGVAIISRVPLASGMLVRGGVARCPRRREAGTLRRDDGTTSAEVDRRPARSNDRHSRCAHCGAGDRQRPGRISARTDRHSADGTAEHLRSRRPSVCPLAVVSRTDPCGQVR
jgi:aryl-alcohol dehydrogenase-like predicted oxidoreductase